MSDPKLKVGSGRCQCARCGRYFGGVTGFDLHQRDGEDGRPVCQDPATLTDKHGRRLLIETAAGFWVRSAPEAFAREPAETVAGVADFAPEGIELTGGPLERQRTLL